jgi:hypothetical protein
VKAMHVKRSWITLEPNIYYTIMSRIQFLLGEAHNRTMMQANYQQQILAKKQAK